MIIIFFIGIFIKNNKLMIPSTYIYALFAIFFSYINAVSINDLEDYKIDLLNKKNNQYKTLIKGELNRDNLITINIISLFLTLLFAFLINYYALIVIIITLIINYLYSLKYFRLSDNTYTAYFLLVIAYIFIPYILGMIVAKSIFNEKTILFLIPLSLLSLSALLLKDFKDQKGDLKYKKITFLLRYGKNITCNTSLFLISISYILFIFILKITSIPIFLIFTLSYIYIFYIVYLLKISKKNLELTIINIVSISVNGILILILSFFILTDYKSNIFNLVLFLSFIFITYTYTLYTLLKNTLKKY